MKNEIEYYIGNKVLLNWNEYGFSINHILMNLV